MEQLNFHYSRWLKIPAWLAKPKHFWIFTIGVLVASLLGDWLVYTWDISSTREDRIRFSGWLLDTLGLVTIAIGISSKLDRFEGRNLIGYALQQILTWLQKFPLISQEQIINCGTADIKCEPSSSQAYGVVKINQNAPISKKVDWLLENYYTLVNTVHTQTENSNKKLAEIENKIQELDINLRDNIERVREETADIHTGEVGIEFVGLFWLFCGITFATIPEFIEVWLSLPIRYFEILGQFVGLG